MIPKLLQFKLICFRVQSLLELAESKKNSISKNSASKPLASHKIYIFLNISQNLHLIFSKSKLIVTQEYQHNANLTQNFIKVKCISILSGFGFKLIR